MIPRSARVLIAVLVLACDSTAPASIASVSISPVSMDVGVGGTRQLDATAFDANGAVVTGRSISWTSTAAAVASVSESGIVTGKALGITTVTAAIDGISGTALIRVPTQQATMDGQTAGWVEDAIGFELYNAYVAKTPSGTKNISTGCPHGGSVDITGTTTTTSQIQQVNLVYVTHACRVNTATDELRVTGRVTMIGSWSLFDNSESLVYAAADSATISGTARLADGTLFSVSETCILAITRSVNAAGNVSTLSGTVCGRPFSR